MADITIAPFDKDESIGDTGFIQNPLRGTAQLVSGGVSVTSSDTLIIQAQNNTDLEIYVTTGATPTVTLLGGDYPGSAHAVKGNSAIVLATGTNKITPDAGRHTFSDGTIRMTTSGTVTVRVFRQDSGFKGSSHMNRFAIPQTVVER